MKFQSLDFLLIFLPIVVAVYYVSKNNSFRNVILIISSLIFYSWGNLWWSLILILSASVDYFLAQKISQCDLESNQNKRNLKRKLFLILSIFLNIGLLIFFKYWDWIITSVENYSKIELGFLKHNLPLPAAISFYTFESLSYIFDIYRRKWQPSKKFIYYLTFIAFFPKLVAGPIMRAHELIPQLEKFRKKVSSKNLEFAIFLICWGLCKKLVFADNLGNIVESSYKNISIPGVGLILAISFTFQNYCDFSAYCDIARGCAKIFSVRLKRNFLTPYFATNGADFFRRWNISLSSWVKDYVYSSIATERSTTFIKIIGIYTSMILIGMWHGVGIFFIYYGIFVATMIIFYKATQIDKILIKYLGKIGLVIAIFLAFTFVVFGMTIFWIKSDADFIVIFSSFFQFFTIPFSDRLMISESFSLFAWRAFLFITPIFLTDLIAYKKNREFVDLYPVFGFKLKVITYVLLFYLILFFAYRGSNDFIYFQF